MFTYACQIVRVIDGDTVVADIDLGFRIHYTAHVRLAGINAPELHDATGPASKAHLELLLANKQAIEVYTSINHEFEKYGRVLGDFLADGMDINGQMMADGFAVRMDG